MQNKNGYILVLTLMALALSTAVVTRLYYQGTAFIPFAEQFVKKEKAKMLALSGVQLAMSRLAGNPEQIAERLEKGGDKNKLLLERILPLLNTWDEINLEEMQDGIKGKIKIYLASEEGKTNINLIYDFDKHELNGGKENQYYDEYLDRFLAQLAKASQNKIDPQDAKKQLLKFLSERSHQLSDVTELLKFEAFAYLQDYVFVEPAKDQEDATRIYLTDLFTTFNNNVRWQPWMLSASTQALLGFPRPKTNDIFKKEENVSQWLKGFNSQTQWNNSWDKILAPVYGIESNELPNKFIGLFSSDFNMKFFSVVSHGTFGGVTQKVYAIIQVQSKGDRDTSFSVAKIYWI